MKEPITTNQILDELIRRKKVASKMKLDTLTEELESIIAFIDENNLVDQNEQHIKNAYNQALEDTNPDSFCKYMDADHYYDLNHK